MKSTHTLPYTPNVQLFWKIRKRARYKGKNDHRKEKKSDEKCGKSKIMLENFL